MPYCNKLKMEIRPEDKEVHEAFLAIVDALEKRPHPPAEIQMMPHHSDALYEALNNELKKWQNER